LDLQALASVHWGSEYNSSTNHISFEPEQAIDAGKHTTGGAMEHLSHVIFGLQPHHAQPPSRLGYCQHFLHDSQCPGSPCSDAPDATIDPDYVPADALVT
jgi:hypothetical protein